MRMFNLLFKISRKLPGINVLIRMLYHCDVPRRTKITGGDCPKTKMNVHRN